MAKELNSEGTLNPYVANGGDIQPNERYGYKIIAVIYPNNFWKAYRGLTDWDDRRVATEGDEISQETAVLLFPTIAVVCTWY